MASINLTAVSVESVYVEPMGIRQVEATLNGINVDDILEQIDIKDAISYYGSSDLLNEIGRDDAVDHFGIEEAES